MNDARNLSDSMRAGDLIGIRALQRYALDDGANKAAGVVASAARRKPEAILREVICPGPVGCALNDKGMSL